MDFAIPLFYTSEDQLVIRRALHLAERKHAHQLRKSGEPYIVHPVGVAEILMDLPAKPDVVAAGLLHDVLEDTDTNFEDIEKEFGFDIAKIVNAVSHTKRLERITKNHPEDKRRELHHSFLDTIKDIRPAVVKLADRLHNCRTIGFLEPTKQHEIAEETLLMYVPLARQIGLPGLERELAAICLDVLPKWDYQRVQLDAVKYEREIIAKGYHQNKLDLCLLR